MDSLEKMNGALRYIEENLTNEIDFKNLARLLVARNIILKECFLS